MEREYFEGEFDLERPKGIIYDKKPFKVKLEAGKMYAWCSCGRSRNQVRSHTLCYDTSMVSDLLVARKPQAQRCH